MTPRPDLYQTYPMSKREGDEMSKRPATTDDYRDAALAMVREYAPRVDQARQLIYDICTVGKLDIHGEWVNADASERLHDFAERYPCVKVKADGRRRLLRTPGGARSPGEFTPAPGDLPF